MFWMSFDQKLGENVEEHSACVYACLCIGPAYTTCVHAYAYLVLHMRVMFMRMCPCISVHMDECKDHSHACTNLCVHLAFKNPNFHYFDSFLFISLSNGNSQVLFLSFCKSRLPF